MSPRMRTRNQMFFNTFASVAKTGSVAQTEFITVQVFE